jgi:MoxR-like ATPase
MRIQLGYPGADAERELLKGQDRRDLLQQLTSTLRSEDLGELQQQAQQVHVSPALLDYVQALVNHTRASAEYANGLSPRAALALLHAARAWALMESRRHVIPEDIQAVLPGVVGHRLMSRVEGGRSNGFDVAEQLIGQVAIP